MGSDQHWKTEGLDKDRYRILKRCGECDGASDEDPASGARCLPCGGSGYVSVDEDAAYLVLRIDCDPETGQSHDTHARTAGYEYAKSLWRTGENDSFAKGIYDWLVALKEAALRPSLQQSDAFAYDAQQVIERVEGAGP